MHPHLRRLVQRAGLLLLAAGIVLILPATAGARPVGPTTIQLDGFNLYTDVPAESKDGRTFVPIRFLAEAMGLQVDWLQDQRTVIVRHGADTPLPVPGPADLPAGAPDDQDIKVLVESRWIHPDVAAYGRDNRVLVPVRFVAEALGLAVGWDQDTRTVLLQSADPDSSYRQALGDRTPQQVWLADMNGDSRKDVVAVFAPDLAGPARVALALRSESGWTAGPAVDLAGFGAPVQVDLVRIAGRLGPQVHLTDGRQDRLLLYRSSGRTWIFLNWGVYRPDRDVLSEAPPPPADGKNRVIIAKSRNLLYLYLKGELVKVFPIASGRSTTLTPVGIFPVVIKAVNPAWKSPEGKIFPGGIPENPLGSRWIGISVEGDDGLHYGLHGTNNPLSIGTYASSGCVRMVNEQAEDLYDLVPVGTPVEIRP